MLVISVGCQLSLVERAPSAIANEETASGKNSLQVNSDVNLTLNSFPSKLTVIEFFVIPVHCYDFERNPQNDSYNVPHVNCTNV